VRICHQSCARHALVPARSLPEDGCLSTKEPLMSPTIRHLAGIAPADAIDASTTALLLIDFQNEYFDGRLPIPDGLAALGQAVQLMQHADRHGMPVFHVRHMGAAGGMLFAEGGALAEIHPALAPASHHAIVPKRMVSSFAGTELHERLRARGIATLIVAGLMTHMCVSTAVRDARQFGNDSYRVLVAADACATRDIDAWNGGVMPHRTLHDATLTALSDNFADVLTTSAILALPLKA
jgi:nicotinamidase-related amidase